MRSSAGLPGRGRTSPAQAARASRATDCSSRSSDMSIRIIPEAEPKRCSASRRAVSVLPTPLGPTNSSTARGPWPARGRGRAPGAGGSPRERWPRPARARARAGSPRARAACPRMPVSSVSVTRSSGRLAPLGEDARDRERGDERARRPGLAPVPQRQGRARPLGRLVHELDRLLRELAVGLEAHRQVDRGHERLVGDRDAALALEPGAQLAQLLQRLVAGRRGRARSPPGRRRTPPGPCRPRAGRPRARPAGPRGADDARRRRRRRPPRGPRAGAPPRRPGPPPRGPPRRRRRPCR